MLVVVVIISVGIVYLLLFTTASRMYSVVGIVLIDSILIYLFCGQKKNNKENNTICSRNENGSSRNYICAVFMKLMSR